MPIDPQELAKRELAEQMIPTPDDVCASLSPLAALYYIEQLGWAVYTLWTAHVADSVTDDAAVNADLAETLSGVGLVVGELDAVCVRIGLIPPEAIAP